MSAKMDKQHMNQLGWTKIREYTLKNCYKINKEIIPNGGRDDGSKVWLAIT